MFIRWIWILVSALACSSVPLRPDNALDCIVKENCFLVKVDNGSNRYRVELRINGIKYGDIGEHNTAEYNLYSNRLRNGNCAIVSAKFSELPNRPILDSDEECIYPGQYFSVQITTIPFKVWLTPFRLSR